MDDSKELISQVHSLENGNGLQYLINEAYKILGNPLVLFNMEYELMFYVEKVVTDDRFWNELVGKGVFSEESIRIFLEECFIDDVANSKTIALLKSDKLKYDRLYGRIFNSYNETVADLIMVACDKPIQNQDFMLFEAICGKLSQEIRGIEFYKKYGILYHERLICKLLDDDIKDKVVYSGHLSNLYEDLKANLYVVAADIGEYKADKSKLGEYRDLFKEKQPSHKYAVYSDYIVIIASSDEANLSIKRDLPELEKIFIDKNIRIGISSNFENLFNLRKYYDEAVSTI